MALSLIMCIWLVFTIKAKGNVNLPTFKNKKVITLHKTNFI
jgi:hypothetical protein